MGQVLFVGEFEGAPHDLVQHVAATGIVPEFVPSAEEALARIGHTPTFAAVLSPSWGGAQDFCMRLRSSPKSQGLPVIAVVADLEEATIAAAFRQGADDFVLREDGAALRSRLAVTRGGPPELPPARAGRAIVADADRMRRVLYGREVRQAGFDVEFAEDAVALERALTGSPARLVVASADLEPDGAVATLRGSRGREADGPPWVVVVQSEGLRPMQEVLAGLRPAAAFDTGRPPSDLLFVVNELTLPAPVQQKRASQRLLHSTPVSFRPGGSSLVQWGTSYNVSRSGLFVRTLVPASVGLDLWLELRPPGDPKRVRPVRLDARVAWCKRFGDKIAPATPVGMGLLLTGGSAADVAIFEQAYDALLASTSETSRPPA